MKIEEESMGKMAVERRDVVQDKGDVLLAGEDKAGEKEDGEDTTKNDDGEEVLKKVQL